MPQFTVNASRLDPYKNFKFRVIWDGRVVAGVSYVSALVRTTDVVTFRNGGEPSSVRRMPGQTQFEPITLERGVTHDLEFERWANKVWHLGAGLGAEMLLKDFRKDVRLELMNEAGQVVLAYLIYRCWVSRYEALPELDASSNAIAIQSITLENEGWERDTAVTEPQEPSFDTAAPPPSTGPAPTPPGPPPAPDSPPPPSRPVRPRPPCRLRPCRPPGAFSRCVLRPCRVRARPRPRRVRARARRWHGARGAGSPGHPRSAGPGAAGAGV